MSAEHFEQFDDFWLHHLEEHRNPVNRALHYAGLALALGTVGAAVVTRNAAWLLLTPVVGYGPAWIGHVAFEKNLPEAFRYPLWSLRADLKMLELAIRGGSSGTHLQEVA
jgi:hypothetical protein